MRRTFCALLVLALLSAGCGRPPPAFEVRKKAVTVAAAMQLMRDAKKKPAAALAAQEYASARAEAIQSFVDTAEEAGADSRSLRRALETVTPAKSRNEVLPTRVIEAPFDGRRAWIIVQNWNKPGRDLIHAKVWAIGVRDQSFLYSASLL